MVGIHDLRYFRVAATASSLRKAARSLLVTQPALTHAVRRLETHIGHPLFERRRTGVKLTPAGTQLLAQVEPLIVAWDALGQGLAEAERRVQGRVVLGCHPSVAQYTLPRFVPELLAKHPELELRLVHDLSRGINEQVNGGTIDVGLVVNPLSFPDLVIRPLLEDRVGFWARAAAPADLLVCDPNLAQTQWLLRKLPRKAAPFRRVIESSNLEVIRTLAEAGAGLAILPYRVAKLGRDLRPVRRLGAPYVDRLCLVHRPAFARSFLGRTVLDAITKAVAYE